MNSYHLKGILMRFLTLSLMSCFLLASCGVKVKTTQKSSTHKSFLKAGSRCTFTGEDGGSKDIFLQKSTNEKETSLNFHDFKDDGKISLIGAKLNDALIITISLKKFSPKESLTGTYPLSTKGLVSSKGEIMTSYLEVVIDNEMDVLLLRKNLLKVNDENVSTEVYLFGTLENCTQTEERWL
jgi:hypothetical protein